ncbi:hypothetical protein TVAG_013370 [Trichomonas vaginalis G3]|uniref:Uncharacterized protein n=1 Tax=Trichomonas vaginalis (strain ATCC PRA-98 / G3) TaxID=412133 RepID=A2DD93_TRIV3|nr:hypothetical protein TVAGG3_0987080 [Trichomonas vaginalis G3]EAY21572.1 hypothetical protein TVAG_013370 [Trichomonas vaginalis G3]KAI5489754.1 hypothetical protein TVAGG3_0987080 [Trichomonas vaginalis G3]|eukprot:XP_001582558.1 hypothetical protein [Trichomonas vaginalis G3]
MEFTTFKKGRYEYGFIDNELYLKVFYHDIQLGGYFTNKNEARWNDKKYKYSILTEIDDKYRDTDGLFQFSIVYPELRTFNVWKQKNNPLNEPKVIKSDHKPCNVTGYQYIKVLADRKDDLCVWGGLCLSDSDALIDGCQGLTDWYFAIGYTGVMWAKQVTIPSNGVGVNVVSLWVRASKKIIYEPCITSLPVMIQNLQIFSFIFIFLYE